MTQEEENKVVVRRLVDELHNGGKVELAGEFFGKACILHFPRTPGPLQGTEAIKGFVAMIHSTFPDFHITIEDMIAEGEKVVVRGTISGTFKDAFAGIPPTGQSATWTATGVYHVVDGKVVEVWEDVDMLGGFQRLGVIPALA